ncbi:hypothetical protein D3C72_1798870 [compost metagenome]
MLTPASHASIDQRRVTRLALFRAQAQAFHHTRAHAFDQHIGAFDQFEHQRSAFSAFEVRHHRALAAIERVARGIFVAGDRRGFGAFNRNHIGTQIRQVHGAERPGTDTADFDNLDT